MTARSLIRIAHRGGGSLAPENSVLGIERSLEYGVEMIEVDIRRTRDGVLALSHEPVPHGTTTPMTEATLGELRAESPDIATLDEALDAVKTRARLNLDIKTPDLAREVVETVRRHGALDRCIVSCLDPACLGEVARMEPALPRFWSYPPDYGGASQRPWLKPVVNAVVAGMRMTMPRRLERTLRPLPGHERDDLRAAGHARARGPRTPQGDATVHVDGRRPGGDAAAGGARRRRHHEQPAGPACAARRFTCAGRGLSPGSDFRERQRPPLRPATRRRAYGWRRGRRRARLLGRPGPP